MNRGTLRIVLEAYRDFRADPREDGGDVADDLVFGPETYDRRHHHPCGASIHGAPGEGNQIVSSRITDTDDDGHAAPHTTQHALHKNDRLVRCQLLGFAHHAQNGDPVDSLFDVEFD